LRNVPLEIFRSARNVGEFTNTGEAHFIGRTGSCIKVGSEVFTGVTMKNAIFWDIKANSYFTGDTLRLRYRSNPVTAM
jgi:hypothetical protein